MYAGPDVKHTMMKSAVVDGSLGVFRVLNEMKEVRVELVVW